MPPGGGALAGALERYNAATAHLEPPFAVIDLAALRANAAAMPCGRPESRSG